MEKYLTDNGYERSAYKHKPFEKLFNALQESGEMTEPPRNDGIENVVVFSKEFVDHGCRIDVSFHTNYYGGFTIIDVHVMERAEVRERIPSISFSASGMDGEFEQLEKRILTEIVPKLREWSIKTRY